MRVYVSGAISNRIRANRIRVFAEVSERLRARGHTVVNPLDRQPDADGHHPESVEYWRASLKLDIVRLLACDAVYMLVGWRNSRGARLERTIAKRLGLRVIYAPGRKHE